MSENEFEIDGVPIWQSDCYVDDHKDPEDYVLTVTYKGKHHYIWSYHDIKDAVENGVDTLLDKCITFEKVRAKDVKELHTFFIHWLKIIDNSYKIYRDDEE